jgi:hypothetical protein
MRTIAAPGFLAFSERVCAGSRLPRSRRGTIDWIPTAIVHRRIRTRRRSARIRAGWRVTGTGPVESTVVLRSRGPIVAGQLGLVFLLAMLKERVEVVQARILRGFQSTEEEGEVGWTLLVGFKHAPRGIREIDAPTSKKGRCFKDSGVVGDHVLSGDLCKIEGIENLVLDFM